jgi:small multidrug resistance family-3 protein
LLLAGYGFFVTWGRWDFGRLIGVYIALFFLVAQGLAHLVFREPLHPRTVVGGALIVAGGLVLSLWRGPGQ